jgi:hypothetical protein
MDSGTPCASRWVAMRVSRPGLVGSTLLLAAALCASCNTPTLPIPPPITEPLMGPDPATGRVTVRVTPDHALTDALYLMVLNQETQRAVIEARRIDGSFVVEIEAARGDCLTGYWMLQIYEVGQGTRSLCVP